MDIGGVYKGLSPVGQDEKSKSFVALPELDFGLLRATNGRDYQAAPRRRGGFSWRLAVSTGPHFGAGRRSEERRSDQAQRKVGSLSVGVFVNQEEGEQIRRRGSSLVEPTPP